MFISGFAYKHEYLTLQIIYVNMQHIFAIFNIIMLHADTNKLYVNIIL